MLVIRLTRTGKKHAPHYRIVVQEKRSKIDGRSIAILGHYHPTEPNKTLVVNHEEAKMWIGRGAQLSDTVNHLFVKDGILPPSAKKAHPFTVKPKEEKEEKAEKPAKEEKEKVEETAEEAVEEPAAEEAEVTEESEPEKIEEAEPAEEKDSEEAAE